MLWLLGRNLSGDSSSLSLDVLLEVLWVVLSEK